MQSYLILKRVSVVSGCFFFSQSIRFYFFFSKGFNPLGRGQMCKQEMLFEHQGAVLTSGKPVAVEQNWGGSSQPMWECAKNVEIFIALLRMHYKNSPEVIPCERNHDYFLFHLSLLINRNGFGRKALHISLQHNTSSSPVSSVDTWINITWGTVIADTAIEI